MRDDYDCPIDFDTSYWQLQCVNPEKNMVKFQFNTQQSCNAHKMALVSKINQLEGELQQKDMMLNTTLKEQIKLGESLEACIKILQKATSQLYSAKNDLINNCSQIINHIENLARDSKAIESANNAWSNRSINLEFDVLTAQEEIKTIKASHDLVVSKMALLEIELKSVKLENETLKRQKDK